MSEYDTKAQATVNFEVGSSKISAKDQIELKELANTPLGSLDTSSR